MCAEPRCSGRGILCRAHPSCCRRVWPVQRCLQRCLQSQGPLTRAGLPWGAGASRCRSGVHGRPRSSGRSRTHTLQRPERPHSLQQRRLPQSSAKRRRRSCQPQPWRRRLARPPRLHRTALPSRAEVPGLPSPGARDLPRGVSLWGPGLLSRGMWALPRTALRLASRVAGAGAAGGQAARRRGAACTTA